MYAFAGVSSPLSISPFQVYLLTTRSVFSVACCTRRPLLTLLVVLVITVAVSLFLWVAEESDAEGREGG